MPPKVVSAKGAKKAGKAQKAAKSGEKKRRHKRKESYSSYIYKVLKQVIKFLLLFLQGLLICQEIKANLKILFQGSSWYWR